MKLFYGILAAMCTVGILLIIVFQVYQMMWGKIAMAFAAAFLVSAAMKLFDGAKSNEKNSPK